MADEKAVIGKIKMIGKVQSIGTNGFTKREVVITTEEQYPQTLMIEFVKDKCDLLDNFKEGQRVKIDINLRGREWTNPQGEVKYFNSLQGWRIKGDGSSGGSASQNSDGPEDDLPF